MAASHQDLIQLEKSNRIIAKQKLEKLLSNLNLLNQYKITFDINSSSFILTNNPYPIMHDLKIDQHFQMWHRQYNKNQLSFTLKELLSLDVQKVSILIKAPLPHELQNLSTGALRDILEKFIDQNSVTLEDSTYFYWVKEFINKGADPTVTTPKRGWNILHAAIFREDVGFIRWLKEKVTPEQWNTLLDAKTTSSKSSALSMAPGRKNSNAIIELLAPPQASHSLQATVAPSPVASDNRYSHFPAPASAAQKPSSTLKDEISNELICPITQEMMTDPVICADGHTYERSAIEDWFKAHDTSPLTNEPLASLALISNRALKQVIERMKEAAPSEKATQRPSGTK